MPRDKLISLRSVEERLKELEEEARREEPYRPDFAAKLVERTLLEVRRIVRDATAEYVSTGVAAELTGWEPQTLRKYAKRMIDGVDLPPPWETLVARRDGRDYALLLSSVPPKPVRNAA